MERYSIYKFIHKGLRAALSSALVELGKVNDRNRKESDAVLDGVHNVLRLCSLHLKHENNFIHAALARIGHPGPLQSEQDHEHHVSHIRTLENKVKQVRNSYAENDFFVLYIEFSLFVAENFYHMHHEETDVNRLLWHYYSDEEIVAIELAILQSLTEEESFEFTMLILEFICQSERLSMLRSMKVAMPAERFRSLVVALKDFVSEQAWIQLVDEVGLKPELKAI
ncbi:hypothetical protein [Rheinheimera fenheensis]|uniref:hypothetical protein n=1 Tax=Rheinheimera fenheensis TaxID=3152295 RepID=UPI00325DEF40